MRNARVASIADVSQSPEHSPLAGRAGVSGLQVRSSPTGLALPPSTHSHSGTRIQECVESVSRGFSAHIRAAIGTARRR